MQDEKKRRAQDEASRCGNPADLTRLFCSLNRRNEQTPHTRRDHNAGGKPEKQRLGNTAALAANEENRRSAERRACKSETCTGSSAEESIRHVLLPFEPLAHTEAQQSTIICKSYDISQRRPRRAIAESREP